MALLNQGVDNMICTGRLQ